MGAQQLHVDVVHQHEKNGEAAQKVDSVESFPGMGGERVIHASPAADCERVFFVARRGR
jgi:hypothetical protein